MGFLKRASDVHIFVISNLFPNCQQVRHGVFVRERFRHVLQHSRIERLTISIIAPIPWCPGRKSLARLAAIPRDELDKEIGLVVHHPRYLAIPLLGNLISPILYAASVWKLLRKSTKSGEVIILDGQFGFPDNAGVALLSKVLGLPCALTYRGSDLNRMALERGINSWTRWSLKVATEVITVSDALKEKALALGAPLESCKVIRNGVDRTKFCLPEDRNGVRKQTGFTNPTILSVGNLIPLKGHDLVISALADLPKWDLVIIGSGPKRAELERGAVAAGVSDRVKFVNEISQSELVRYYQAADLLILASASEGLPNVVLEALACGTPVIATDVGGVREVLTSPIQGALLQERTANALKSAVRRWSVDAPNPDGIRESTRDFDWLSTVNRLDETFKRLESNSHANSTLGSA